MRPPIVALALFVCSASAAYGGQNTGRIRLTGQVVDAETDEPVPAVEVFIVETAVSVRTDTLGRFTFIELEPGRVQLRLTRIGYMSTDTVVYLNRNVIKVRFVLESRPIRLRPITARAERLETGGAQAARALFEREPRPGVVGVGRKEIESIPAAVAPDLLRSLQALPGVVTLNDLSAQLHVRGGGPDQNLFLLDGARIFAPYHLFGLFGAFNTDAIGSVEFYRGSLPARYGGALSSAIVIQQRTGPVEGLLDFYGGMSLLGMRATIRGEIPWATGDWMLAGRRTYLDLVADDIYDTAFPYSFYDIQGRVAFIPAPRHRVGASFFASRDRLRLFFEDYSTGSLRTGWRNAAGSIRWDWARTDGRRGHAMAWFTSYDGRLSVGETAAPLVTVNRIRIGGIRLETIHQNEELGVRVGLDIRGGSVALLSPDQPGGFVVGETRDTYIMPAAYLEAEYWLGNFRLVPGLRLSYVSAGHRVFVEPRLAARYYINEDVTVTAGLGRTHQFLSTLRDDRYVLPGAPLWFVRPADAPASQTDGASISLEAWLGPTWNVHIGAYGRRFRNIPHWQPVGIRELSQITYDDGTATGIEVMLRRHAGRITGWIGYGLARVRRTSGATGDSYFAVWDRRHSVDSALFVDLWDDLSLSARFIYGSGRPFWAPVAKIPTYRFKPLRGRIHPGQRYLLWADQQLRFPGYLRVDIGIRYPFDVGGIAFEPFASVVNVNNHQNVLFYDLGINHNSPFSSIYNPVNFPYFGPLPTVGIDVSF